MQVKRIDSSDENVSKYVFDFGNAVAEAVLYKYPTYEDRTVICCSTQSGCPVGCRFCGAGDAFFSGALAGLARGDSLAAAVVTGTEVAACTIQSAENNCIQLAEQMGQFRRK